MTTRDAVTRPAVRDTAGHGAAGKLGRRALQAAAVPVLLFGVLLTLPFLLLVCAGEAQAALELEEP